MLTLEIVQSYSHCGQWSGGMDGTGWDGEREWRMVIEFILVLETCRQEAELC